MTQEELAGLLYDSLQNKIMPLADDIMVYPAHGAGSACGKNMQKETQDTLGNQKKTNYALNQPNKETFVKEVLDGLTSPPQYFGMNVAMNKGGYESFETVLQKGNHPLSVEEFEEIAEQNGALILDTRNAEDFHQAFVPNSINIGLKGDFAPWVGAMVVDVMQPILLVCDNNSEEEAVTRLARVGFDNVLGYLKGGVDTWKTAGREVDSIERISAEELENLYQENSKIIDVRKESEYSAEHLETANSLPLSDINAWTKNLDKDQHFFIHCAGGYRSMIAASILNARGIRNFTEIEGGFNKIKETALPKTNYTCPNSK
jgi:rhodanese-related sulfurtransferase